MRWTLALFLFLSVHTAWAWGPQGHMIVAQVAENNLTPAAKKAVATILKGQTLAEVATWADVVKGGAQWSHTKGWHFVDIPDGENYATAEHAHDGDSVTAITQMIQVLKQRNATPVDKEIALKFLVHFVGDLHQPLHVGRPTDRGGNDTRVTFEGRSTNLHALWDTQLIMKTPMDYVQYANALEHRNFVAAPYDLPEFSFSQVIQECMGARASIYNFRAVNGGPVVLDAGYYNRNLALMNNQLLVGGQRLAFILNTIMR